MRERGKRESDQPGVQKYVILSGWVFESMWLCCVSLTDSQLSKIT